MPWIPALVALAGLLFLLAYSLARQSNGDRLGVQAVKPAPAPDFTLDGFDGGTLQLSSFKGQPVVVNFWASWCIPCREEAPTLERAWATYKDKGVIFLGANVWDTQTDARAFLKEFGITYPNGMDRDGKAAIDYGVRGVPETFFVDRRGNLTSKYVGSVQNGGSARLQLGAINQDYLSKTVEALLR
ncbi:MAG: TlpA family protein disulfide reductase [Chloroflexota bacterium]|nr:TlpA family protein disulfide reductase [Chloroflexota bacterium]